MRVTVQQQNLKKAIHLVERIVSRNISLPILNNILLKTENGRLRVIATNLEIGITCTIGAKIDEQGEIAVPGRIIADLLNTTPEGSVLLTTKNNTLHIAADLYKTNILGSDPKDYPTIPRIKTPAIAAIPAAMLRSVLASVVDSIATSEARPELSGLSVQFTEQATIFAATDSFRLAERKVQGGNKVTQSVIIPRSTITELIRLSSDQEAVFEIKVADNQIALVSEDVEIVSRLIDGTYPDYAKVIPERVVSKVLVSKIDLEKSIRLAGLFSSGISDIKLQCEESGMTISSKNSEKGDVQSKTEAILKNEPFELALNFNYILDGLKIIPTEKIIIEFTGQGSPLILKPDNESVQLLYLIMPLRN